MSFICLFIFMCPFRCACFCQHWSTSPAAPEARQYGHPALQHLCGNYRFFTSGGAVASEARGTRGKRPHVFWGQQRPPHSDPDLRRAHADLQQRQRSERRPRVCRLLQVKNLLGQWRGSGTLSVSGGGLVAGSARRMVQYRCESRVGDRTPVPVRTRWVWLDRICFHTGITRVTECAAVELKDSLRFDVFFSQLLICCSFLSWSACRRRCSWVYWLLRRWRAASWRDWLDSALTSGSRKYERDQWEQRLDWSKERVLNRYFGRLDVMWTLNWNRHQNDTDDVMDRHVILTHMWMWTQTHVDSLQAVTLWSALFPFALLRMKERTSHGGYKPLPRFKLEPECSCFGELTEPLIVNPQKSSTEVTHCFYSAIKCAHNSVSDKQNTCSYKILLWHFTACHSFSPFHFLYSKSVWNILNILSSSCQMGVNSSLMHAFVPQWRVLIVRSYNNFFVLHCEWWILQD